MSEMPGPGRFALIGAPYDGAATLGWPGSRYGPEEVRRALRWLNNRAQTGEVYALDEDRIVPWDPAWLVDAGDAPVVPSDAERTREAIRAAVAARLAAGDLPILVGGDDSVVFPFIQAFHDACAGAIGLIHLDAHLDLLDESAAQGRYSHSSGVRRSLELPRLSARNAIQIGTRNFNFAASKRFIDSIGLTELPACEFERIGSLRAAERALQTVIGCERVALAIDVDVLDPAFAPGCGAFEPGGLTTRQLFDFIQIVAPRIDAFAITEINPQVDFRNLTSAVGANAIFHFMVAHRKRRRSSEGSDRTAKTRGA